MLHEGEVATDRPGYVWDTYKPTPVMSTYTLAWTVNEYESMKSSSARGVKFEAFYEEAYMYPCSLYPSSCDSPAENVSIMQHPADVGAKMLDHFEQKVFGINYNLPKMDIIAVEQFAFGAMENWGMMTFKSTLFKKPTRLFDLFYLDKIMAHELVTVHFIMSS